MTCYLKKSQIKELLNKLRTFETALYSLFDDFGYDLNDNLGRRNALLSQAQEKELSKILKKEYGGDEVICDGRPGRPDILIKCLDRELECKLTSGHGKSRSFDLQTDYATLKKKGRLDYLYVLTNPSFNKFCVLFFDGLTVEDFHPPANGSRGKSRMNKAVAMKKATVLWGNARLANKILQNKWEDRLEEIVIAKTQRIGSLQYRLKTTSSGAAIEMGKLSKLITKEEERYDKKIKNATDKIEYWKKANPRYSFVLETS